MRWLPWNGESLRSRVDNSTTDHDACGRGGRSDDDDESPRILWAAEFPDGTKLVLVDEHPRRLLIVRSFLERTTVTGNVAIAHKIRELGVLREDAKTAREALPAEISEEFVSEACPTSMRTPNAASPENQLELFAQRKAG